jgi:hypothetical protein
MKISLPDNRDVGEAVGDSNEGMKEARDRYDALQKADMDNSMENSRVMQQRISSGSDFTGRPQDEGYRPNAGTARERAIAEGAYDSDKIVENTGPRTKPSKPAIVTKEALEKSGMSLREYMNKQQGLTARKEKDPTAGDSPDKAAQAAADAIDPGRDVRAPRYTPPGQAPKQTTQKPKAKVFMPNLPDNSFSGSKFKSGGSVSSASSRADGCAIRGKTRA